MHEWNRSILWRQGHLLNNDDLDSLEALKNLQIDKTDQLVIVVASHDCDLLQDPKVESKVEVIIGRRVVKNDGNFTHAKNTRKLHIEYSGDEVFWAEFEATDKLTIDKMELNKFSPNPKAHLSPKNHTIFQMWLASRYRRSAFPEEFERRLTSNKLHEKIVKALRPHGDLIVGIFFDLDAGVEINRSHPDDTYTLDIIIMHSSEPNFEAAEIAAESAANTIKIAFKTNFFDSEKKEWRNIELRYCDHVSESAITYEQFRQLKRWRVEHLSFAADPQQAVLAE